jgi:hypothetical protein
VVSADGVLVRYRVGAFSGTFGVQVLRGSTPDVVGESLLAPAVAAQRDGAYTSILNVPVRIPVRAGDVLGFKTLAPSQYAIRSDGTSMTSQWVPALTPGTAPSGPPFLGPVFARINGDVEPDADRDGYGDLTQDSCVGECAADPRPPVNPNPQAPAAPTVVTVTVPGTNVVVRPGTPKLAVTRLKYRGGRSLGVPLRCDGGTRCAGTLTLLSGKRTTGTAKFSLAAGQRRTVNVKLNARARKALRRGGKLRARLTPATTTGSLTLTR